MTFKEATHYYEQIRRNGIPKTLSAKQTLWEMVEAYSLRLTEEEEKNSTLRHRLDDMIETVQLAEADCECSDELQS